MTHCSGCAPIAPSSTRTISSSPAAMSRDWSRVFSIVTGWWIVAWRPCGVLRAKIGTIGAPVSRAMRIAPGGSVVGRPKNVTGLPF